MKKLLMIAAGFLVVQTVPVLAQDEKTTKAEKRQEYMLDKIKQERANLDSNGDGLLTESEFVSKARKQFKAMDKNSDGFVDSDEMLQNREEKRARKQAQKELRKKAKERADKEGIPNSVRKKYKSKIGEGFDLPE